MSIGERIKEIRKDKSYTQVEFGEVLGATRDIISNIELERVVPSDTMIQLICLKLGVNEEWLRTGKGDKFLDKDTDIISELSEKYDLGQWAIKILNLYISLEPTQKKIIDNFFDELVDTQEKNKNIDLDDTIDKMNYRLVANKKQSGEAIIRHKPRIT